MTKAKTKAQEPEVQKPAEVEQAEQAEQAEQVVVGDGSGEALPEVAEQPAEPEDVIDALVLCDGSLDGVTRFKAGMVLQGIPESLAAANSHWLDAHLAAVEYAQSNGAEVVTYTQEA